MLRRILADAAVKVIGVFLTIPSIKANRRRVVAAPLIIGIGHLGADDLAIRLDLGGALGRR